MNITISKQFQDLIFPLTQEEITILERSILEYGVKDPLVIWQNGRNYLIDGHHRWTIIKRHKITKYKTLKLQFSNKHEAINWVLDNQLGRRNATPEGISFLRGLRYKNEKLQHGGDRKSSEHNVHLKTAQLLAKQYKISHMTIQRDEKFADAIEAISKVFSSPKKQKEVKHGILSRQINLSKKDILELSGLPPKQIIDVIDNGKDLWQVKSDANKIIKEKRLRKAQKASSPKNVKLYVGDCVALSKKHIKPNSIDCIITDPPYADMECFEKLGRIAKRVLKPSSFCCFYCGTFYLPQVMNIMSRYLDYYWQLILLNEGADGTNFNTQTLHARKVDTFYKSILVFQKAPFKKTSDYFKDVLAGSGLEKDRHPWQQGEGELKGIIDTFSAPEQIILDPFLGSGTTAVAALKSCRKFVGFDIDRECVAESRLRVEGVKVGG